MKIKQRGRRDMSSFNDEPAVPAMLNPKDLAPSDSWWMKPADRGSWYQRAAVEQLRMMSSKIAHRMRKDAHDGAVT